MKTRVLVADDHASVRQMLALMLASDGVYQVVGEAGTGFETVKLCRTLKPDLLILDLILPELNGLEVLRELRNSGSDSRFLIYSGTQNEALISAALRARPHGFVHKRDSLATFRDALRAVSAGCCFFTPFATQLLDARSSGQVEETGLTDRERAVLQMIAEGMSNKEMADRLAIACKTVEHHRAHLMEKLNLHDVAHLTRYAVRLGIVTAVD
jgi:DNA-binding NarL/FixJ family response regulator